MLFRKRGPASAAPGDLQRAATQLVGILRPDDEGAYRDLVTGANDRPPMNVTLEASADPDGLRGAPFDQIGAFYLRVRSGRMVILGAGGSGKSVMLIRLALDLFESPMQQAVKRIPVRLSLPNWDVLQQEFADWVVAELVQRSYPADRARLLLENGLLLPLLDGLDEMDPLDEAGGPAGPRSRAALVKLRRDLQPLVLTCRTQVYEAITAEQGQIHTGFTGRLAELPAGEIATQLAGSGDVPDDWWNPVLVELSQTGGDVHRELGTPWRLSIVMALYGAAGDRGHSSKVLIDDIRNPDRLLGKYAEKLLGDTRSPRSVGRTLGTIGQYLAAKQTGLLPGVDFVVHQLWPIGGQRLPRIVSALLTLLLWAPALVAAVWVLVHSDFIAPLRLATFVLLLLFAGLAAWSGAARQPHPRRIAPSRFVSNHVRVRPFVAAGTAVMLGLEAVALGEAWFGVGLALGFVASFGSGFWLAVRDSLKAGPVFAISTAFGALLTVAAWAVIGSSGPEIGFVAGMAVGGVTLVATVPIALSWTKAAPGYDTNPVFRKFVRDDFVVGSFCGVLAAIAIFLLLSSPDGFGFSQISAGWCALAVFVAIGFGTVAEMWRRHLAMWLCRLGSISIFLDHSLDRAYRAGLLRRSGIAYQFRHVELRDYFAAGGPRFRGADPSGAKIPRSSGGRVQR